MNVGEGVRRLGIVLGLVGGAIGVLFGYESAQHLWKRTSPTKGLNR